MADPAPPIVLLHAFPLNAAMWLPQQEALAAQGYRVIAPDQRGFGGVPGRFGTEPPSLDLIAGDLARLLDHHRIDRVVVGGLSMGGYVAMAFLRRYPDRVAGLVLMDTKATADPAPARENRERIARTLLAENSPQVLLDDVLPGLLGETTWQSRPAVVAQVRAMVEAAPPGSAAWAQRAMAARPDSLRTVRSMGSAGSARPPRVLVIRGEEDGLSTPADARAVIEVVGGGGLVTVPRAGHLSSLEQPELVTGHIAEFLRAGDREAAR